MFLGHFALGFAAKKVAPAVSLGTLFLAVQLADLLWPMFLLLGVEAVEIDPGNTAVTPLAFVDYPYSHSLMALGLWAVALAGIYRLMRGGRIAAWTLGLLVISHWLLDALTHRPDLALTIHGPTRVGLGLWNSVPATVVVELLLFLAGLELYRRSTVARDRTGTNAFWGLVAFLVLVYGVNLVSPPPPSPTAVAWSAQALWLLVAWGAWLDRHRQPRARTKG